MAVGVRGEDGIPGTYFEHDGHRYYYLETTAAGWDIGEAPEDMKTATAEIVPIDSSPVVVISYAVDIADDVMDGISVEVGTKNVGDAPGSVVVQALFEDKAKNTVAMDESTPQTIAPDAQTTTTLQPAPPADETLRTKIRVKVDGTPHDQLTSDYQTPISEQIDEDN